MSSSYYTPLLQQLAGVSTPRLCSTGLQRSPGKSLPSFVSYNARRQGNLFIATSPQSAFSTNCAVYPRRWTPEDNKKLCELRLRGLPTKSVAKELERTPRAVEAQLCRLRNHQPQLGLGLRLADRYYTEGEDQLIMNMRETKCRWAEIAEKLPSRSPASIKERYHSISGNAQFRGVRSRIDEAAVKRRRWTAEEDKELRRLRDLKLSAEEISQRLSRSPSAIIMRCCNLGLDPLSTGRSWTPEEDAKLLVRCGGASWAQVAAQIPGRSANQAAARCERIMLRSKVVSSNLAQTWSHEEDALLLGTQASNASLDAVRSALSYRTIGECLVRSFHLRGQARSIRRRPSIHSD